MLNEHFNYQTNMKLIAIYALLSGFSIAINITLIILYQVHHISPQNFTNSLFENVNSQLLQNNTYIQYKITYHRSYVKVSFIMIFFSIFSQICNLCTIYLHIKLKKNQENQQKMKNEQQIIIKAFIFFIFLSFLLSCNYFGYIISFYNEFRYSKSQYIGLDSYRNIFLPNLILKSFQIFAILTNGFIVFYINKKSELYNVSGVIQILDGDPLFDQKENPLKKFNNNLRIMSNAKHNQSFRNSFHNSFHNQSILSKDKQNSNQQANSEYRILLNNNNIIAQNIQKKNQYNQHFQSEILQYQKNQKKIHQYINFFDEKNTDRTLKNFVEQISKLQISIYKPEINHPQWNQNKKAPFMILQQLNSSSGSQHQSKISKNSTLTKQMTLKKNPTIQKSNIKPEKPSIAPILTNNERYTIDKRSIPRLPIKQMLQKERKAKLKQNDFKLKLDIKKINQVKPIKTIQSFDNPNLKLLNKNKFFQFQQYQQMSIQDL